MSVQFGRWNFDGKEVDREYLDRVQPLLLPYGPDNLGSYSKENISIIHCAFHTTHESRQEKQPHLTPSGSVLTWDGRLDNRTELITRLAGLVSRAATDVSIVAAAYERWENDCFAMLIGDWALSIWNPHRRSLILAKDPIGVRHLYYSLTGNEVIWSTILDPLVLSSEKELSLCQEYIAGWLSYFPATHLTPYIGINSVPPSSSVVITERSARVRKYWDFDPAKKIRYRSDSEYEEHYRAAFAEAVCRRLRSDSPVLAELSGGMDSSAIVCMSDKLIAEGKVETPRLDTVSYYDDSEPNWNERPYFCKVETTRGRTGCHIDVSKREILNFDVDSDCFASIPGSGQRTTEEVKRFAACMMSQSNRVLLSGIGGDEVMGGVPTPILELEDLLAMGQFRTLAQQLKVWALNKRVPWFRLLFMAARRFFPPHPFGVRTTAGPEAWLDVDFVKRNRKALQGLQPRVKLFGPLPSFQGNIATLIGLQRQLTCEILQADPLYEKRYPYLDRDLLEFMYAVPREQLVRPGRRRSLMRRALRDLVPIEILERRRKAYVSRGPVVALQSVRGQIETLLADALTVQRGFIDPIKFARFRDPILGGTEIKEWFLLRKVVIFELWLRTQAKYLKPVEFPEARTSLCPRLTG